MLTGKGCGTKSDIFGLGVIFYNLMTGRALFPGSTVESVLQKNARCDLSRAGKYISLFPSHAKDLLMRMISKKYEERPSA